MWGRQTYGAAWIRSAIGNGTGLADAMRFDSLDRPLNHEERELLDRIARNQEAVFEVDN